MRLLRWTWRGRKNDSGRGTRAEDVMEFQGQVHKGFCFGGEVRKVKRLKGRWGCLGRRERESEAKGQVRHN
jgi:hypothetical protein